MTCRGNHEDLPLPESGAHTIISPSNVFFFIDLFCFAMRSPDIFDCVQKGTRQDRVTC